MRVRCCVMCSERRSCVPDFDFWLVVTFDYLLKYMRTLQTRTTMDEPAMRSPQA